MADKKLLDMANKVAGEFNSEKDFEKFTKSLRKKFSVSTLDGKLGDHLGYTQSIKRTAMAADNGKSCKRIIRVLDQEIGRMEKKLQTYIEQEAEWSEKRTVLKFALSIGDTMAL